MPLPSASSNPTIQADVVFMPDKAPSTEGQPIPVEMGRVDRQSAGRNAYRSLFVTLYTMLLLATAGLAYAVTRYIQVKKSAHILRSSQGTGTATEELTDIDSSSPKTLAEVDPNRDPASYRSDIEYILSREIDGDCSTNFLEGAQKRAIDWLVFDDFVLKSKAVRKMVESLEAIAESNAAESKDSIPTFPLLQRYALMVLFFETNGELWSEQPWTEMVGTEECKFGGVECGLEGHVEVLDLGFRKLRGRLPREVGMLSKLTSMNVMGNNLEGTIPSFIYHKLTNLASLILSKNEFYSTISPDIAKLTNLKALHLTELQLTGQLPADAMKSMSTLEHILFADSTKLSGPILEFSAHWPNLTVLDLYQSSFTGTIPATIGTNTKLEAIWLRDTEMDTSVLPTEFGLLSNLEQLFINAKVPEGGRIPTELGNCPQLRWLHLDGYGGRIPTELGRLTRMEGLSLSRGTVTGTIPSEIGLMTSLMSLYVTGNQLVGTLPSEIGNLREMQDLRLNRNSFSGTIPTGLCQGPPKQIQRDCGVDCECCSTPCSRLE
eukprot:CAMPEP_0172388326 /NCGR_PEP_ID=MMETSP1061-20121228/5454_1 /TAXON_ID=37318 /ORGANISM="Pseudo-nitzschia pungens, Strain cf. pungens" /LENGTH=547 /DNA_ID=CAMNT_0013118197 /DNA_START=24 /DNA_END=1667 /DNA_ORIENTATION=+